jgi:hypothetical protein
MSMSRRNSSRFWWTNSARSLSGNPVVVDGVHRRLGPYRATGADAETQIPS